MGGTITEVWKVENLSISAVAVNAAFETATTSDDTLLIAGALSGADTVLGSFQNDILFGYDGNDTIEGRDGNDRIDGGAGDDLISGGTGNDDLTGGAGTDTASFSGSRSQYYAWKSVDAVQIVGPDGIDRVVGVENFRFSDGTVSATQLLAKTAIESIGATRLAAANAHYFLQDQTGNEQVLKNLGSDVVAGQLGAWTPIAAETNAVGYLVAWKNGAADQFTIWQVDWLGNYTGLTPLGVTTGASSALQRYETQFQQDLNGNGTIGLAAVVIEQAGSTPLKQLAENFLLGQSGITLKYGFADFTAGQFGGWTPIAAEANASGYLVAWKNGAADQFTVWQLDSSGNFAGVPLGVVGGSDSALQLLETSFQQDLNGNGAIGLVPTTIEALGATKLVQLGAGFRLWNATDTGPALKYAGTEFAAGQFGGWTPIATEANASGYLVAWKNGGADQFTVWQLDANGNFAGVPLGVVSGSDSALQLLETSFQQDLNGSGAIGLVPTTIEAMGATKLVQLGSIFRLWNVSDTGPALKYGAEFVAGQFGPWTPIGAEANASGYLVAWKNGAADQFTVWQLDNNGNFSGVHLGVVSGSDAALQLLETSFQQDLNGSGAIGLVPTTIEALGATKLVQLGSSFRLWNAGDTGPTLKYGGAEFAAGQFGPWTPIGAEANASGHLVAWKNGAADQFTVWQVDAHGNYAGGPIGVVSGSDSALQLLETSFQQDLNGSGTIGLVPTTIEALGATKLVQLGSSFRLWNAADTGPALKYGGAEFAAGQFGAWTPIAAEANASGYLVAWKNGSANQFTVWQADSNGNYAGGPIGVVPGSDAGLKQIETLFHQDLNADGILGV